MELREYLGIFRRRAPLILLVLFLCVDVAAVGTWLSPRTYEARALIHVRASSTGGSGYDDAEYALGRIPTYLPLIGAPEVLEPAAAAVGGDPGQVRARLSAANPAGTAHVQVTGSAGTAEEAARLADAGAEALAESIPALEPGPVRIRAELVVPAAVPARPASPNLVLNLTAGVLAGLALGLLAALFAGGRRRPLGGAEDVRRATGLRLLSQVPPVIGRHRRQFGGEAAYRELTAAMLQTCPGQLPRVLLLSSACPEAENAPAELVEGWAGYLADAGWRVGVLEPHTGREPVFAARSVPGWADLLAGRAAPEQVLAPVRGGTVSVVPVGDVAGLPAPGDLAARSTPMIRELAERFDVLLVQTRPAGGPLNNPLLAAAVDAALVLACYRETTDEQLDVTVVELQGLGVTVLGAVMLDVPARRRSRVLHLGTGPGRAEAEAEAGAAARPGPGARPEPGARPGPGAPPEPEPDRAPSPPWAAPGKTPAEGYVIRAAQPRVTPYPGTAPTVRPDAAGNDDSEPSAGVPGPQTALPASQEA